MSTFRKLNTLLAPDGLEARELYERAAPDYDDFRELWLRLAGTEAEGEMLREVRIMLQPGLKVLDAGCGTGAISRIVMGMEPTTKLTMVDLTPAMLERTQDVAGTSVLADISNLPFDDGRFDVVVSAWVIETVPDPKMAVRELLRVLAPNGFLIYTFCSLPDGWLSRAGTALLRMAVERGFAGRFLDRKSMPAHDCDRSRILRFAGGLTTLVVLRKCCSVTDDAVPRPMSEVPETIL